MTRAKACQVPREEAETVRQMLMSRRILAGDLEPRQDGDMVLFPLEGDPELPGLRIVETDFTPKRKAIRSYTDLVHLDRGLASQLPRSFDVIGEVVIVKLPDPLLPHRHEIGLALLRFVPGARVVAMDRGVKGVARVRDLETLAGEGTYETTHRENGISFKVDLGKAYFSPRLGREHGIVAAESQDGEEVLDLFCGMGAFSLTILKKHPTSHAVVVDSNPDAIRLVQENARALGVAGRLSAREADAGVFLATHGHFDRVVMNLPREGYKYLGLVGPFVRAGGQLHFYGLYPKEGMGAAGTSILSGLGNHGAGGEWMLRGSRVVHEYSPMSSLMAFTLEKHGEGKRDPEHE